ncbi:Xylose isomerase-like TIM barrel [Posidoniimonas polymericola]|uniref:Xylose isomerase-like TIM barrel n=1 Tax=Posidoniimonas polymericola TaxID=2528002 RepID=A0A5C5YPW5_9BACT|nr:sugar phosphate isomerase/epimerase family protein [Posidoniimonas polymericola]TWT76817.1 Xylose isomerase-like TIM barrel [Posidoniimonas polymericola]
MQSTSRRQFLATMTSAAAFATAPSVFAADSTTPRYQIGVCDWMILKRQKLGAFPLAEEIGADGLELDMGGLGDRPTFDSKLNDEAGREPFRQAAAQHHLRICSIAMSGFYAQSFAERPTYRRMVGDAIRTAEAFGVTNTFLPLGVKGDLVQRPELRPAIVGRLQELAPLAEQAGVVLGLESALDAEGERRLLEDVGSPAVKIYFNFSNPLQAGRDLIGELRTLGAARISQIHATDQDGVWLQNNDRLDMHQVRATLDELDWQGWLVIERSRDANDPRNVRRNFSANVRYLKSVFQS